MTETYYHGTRTESLPAIMKSGLNLPFLASEPDQAWCWARSYSQHSDGRDVHVLEVEVPNPDRVIPDYNLMDRHEREKALGVEAGEDFDVRSELRRDKWLIKGAQKLRTRAVYDGECGGDASIYLGTIPPDNIREVDRSGRAIEPEEPETELEHLAAGLDRLRRLVVEERGEVAFIGSMDPSITPGTTLKKGRGKMSADQVELESLFERVRAAQFRDKPSRKTSAFVTPDADTARRFGPNVYEVEIEGPVFKTNGGEITRVHMDGWRVGKDKKWALPSIEAYWRGDPPGDALDDYPEWLVPGTAKVVRKL